MLLPHAQGGTIAGIPAALETHNRASVPTYGYSSPKPCLRNWPEDWLTGLLHEAISLRGSMNLSSYDRLFPSQDTHSGKGMETSSLLR